MVEAWAKRFHERRVREERFDAGPETHSFYIHGPVRSFVQMVFTGFIKDTFYAGAAELYQASLQLHRQVLAADPDFHIAALWAARRYGMMKDQVMVGLMARMNPSFQRRAEFLGGHARLLADFPPHYVLKKFVEPLKRREPGYGLGRHAKRVLRRTIRIWGETGGRGPSRAEVYAVKYPAAMRDLLRIVHPKPGEVPGDVARYVLGKEDGGIESGYLKAALRYRGLVAAARYADAAAVAVEAGLPFELLRSTMPAEAYKVREVREAVKRSIGGFALALHGVSLVRKGVPEEEVAELVEKRLPGSRVTSFEALRAAYAAYAAELPRLTEAYAKVYAAKAAKTWEEAVELPGLPVDTRIILVLDMSGSMADYLRPALSITAPLSPRVKSLIMFSDTAHHEDVELLSSFHGLLRAERLFHEKYGESTNIADALELASRDAETGDTIFLVTDEQANVAGSRLEDEYIRDMAGRGVNVVVHNPAPYPVHIANPRHALYTYGSRAESVVGTLRLLALRRLDDDAVHRLILRLAREPPRARIQEPLQEV